MWEAQGALDPGFLGKVTSEDLLDENGDVLGGRNSSCKGRESSKMRQLRKSRVCRFGLCVLSWDTTHPFFFFL